MSSVAAEKHTPCSSPLLVDAPYLLLRLVSTCPSHPVEYWGGRPCPTTTEAAPSFAIFDGRVFPRVVSGDLPYLNCCLPLLVPPTPDPSHPENSGETAPGPVYLLGSPRLVLLQLLPQLIEEFAAPFRVQLALQFFERHGNDVIVVCTRKARSESNSEPQAVQQVKVLLRATSDVGTKEIFARNTVYGKRTSRTRRGLGSGNRSQAFPVNLACSSGRNLLEKTANNPAGFETLSRYDNRIENIGGGHH